MTFLYFISKGILRCLWFNKICLDTIAKKRRNYTFFFCNKATVGELHNWSSLWFCFQILFFFFWQLYSVVFPITSIASWKISFFTNHNMCSIKIVLYFRFFFFLPSHPVLLCQIVYLRSFFTTTATFFIFFLVGEKLFTFFVCMCMYGLPV